ncbi:hypothetical protein J2Y67_004579 [Neobacillus niacini]|nr:hypothetical protein [Neobacillus niacini]MDR7002084.1 hypothetical protein [Neobacillus niacini]
MVALAFVVEALAFVVEAASVVAAVAAVAAVVALVALDLVLAVLVLAVLASVSDLFNGFGFWEFAKKYDFVKQSAPACTCAAGALLYYVYPVLTGSKPPTSRLSGNRKHKWGITCP